MIQEAPQRLKEAVTHLLMHSLMLPGNLLVFHQLRNQRKKTKKRKPEKAAKHLLMRMDKIRVKKESR